MIDSRNASHSPCQRLPKQISRFMQVKSWLSQVESPRNARIFTRCVSPGDAHSPPCYWLHPTRHQRHLPWSSESPGPERLGAVGVICQDCDVFLLLGGIIRRKTNLSPHSDGFFWDARNEWSINEEYLGWSLPEWLWNVNPKSWDFTSMMMTTSPLASLELHHGIKIKAIWGWYFPIITV